MLNDLTKRLSNFEALRIVAFVMIVAIHVTCDGFNSFQCESEKWLFTSLVDSFSRFGVEIFVLIGAYFMCTKNLSPSGIARRWWLLIYPIIIFSLVLFLWSPPHSFNEMLGYILARLQGSTVGYHSIAFDQIWFIYPYLILIALSPLLNHALNSMNRKMHKGMIAVLMALFVLVPTINEIAAFQVLYSVMNPLPIFITLYCTASYVRKYDVSISAKKGLAVGLIAACGTFALVCFYTLVLHAPSTLPNGAYASFRFYEMALTVAGSVFIFLAFKSFKLQNKIISISGKFVYEGFLVHFLILYFVLRFFPFSASYLGSAADYIFWSIVTILTVVALSLIYGLMRYEMDRGIVRLLRMSRFLSGTGRIYARAKKLSSLVNYDVLDTSAK